MKKIVMMSMMASAMLMATSSSYEVKQANYKAISSIQDASAKLEAARAENKRLMATQISVKQSASTKNTMSYSEKKRAYSEVASIKDEATKLEAARALNRTLSSN